MFNEICIFKEKLTKLDAIEVLIKEVADFHLKQDGVIDAHYIKRTHSQKILMHLRRASCLFV